MQLKEIQASFERYKQHLKGIDDPVYFHKWELLKNFSEHWNLESQNLKTVFENCFQSMVTRSFWGGEKESAKAFLMMMLEIDSDYVRLIFRDLLDERKDLRLRIERFIFHCDEYKAEVEKKFGKQVDHYQNDLSIISFYLSFIKPETYCIYEYASFLNYASLIGVSPPPQEFEILRFFKIMKTIYSLSTKDTELQDIINSKLDTNMHYVEKSMLLCHDIYTFHGFKKKTL